MITGVSKNDINFQGRLIIANNLSNKPKKSISKVYTALESLVEKNDYILSFKQDYSKDSVKVQLQKAVMNMFNREESVIDTGVCIDIKTNANASRYVDAAKSAIDKYQKELSEREQKEWKSMKRQQKFDDVKDFAGTMLLFPLFIANDILFSINKKWGAKFEKLIYKII